LSPAGLQRQKQAQVVINTMPLLRAGELTKIVDKAQVSLALTDTRIARRAHCVRQG
jgi:2-aminobenzoate-CoA ligase